ncbi:MAG: helix-turn-helix transcriptional regulator [Lentisphaeria bacterium]|nr:helix-turn-helix transcriptional regulator [Lentisphaeria bacterium]
MSKNFEINHNFSRLPHNYRCLFLEVNQPELAAFCHQGVVCISFVLWQGDWMIERSGKLQSPHLDFYWIYGEGFVVEHKGGVIHAEPGDFIAVPSWYDRRQIITGSDCPHVYIRSNNPELFNDIEQITIRKSLLSKDFQSDVIRLIDSCNPLFPEKSRLRSPLAELVYLQFMEELHPQDTDGSNFRQQFFRAVEKLLPGDPSVSELAKILHLSESACYKKCMESFKTSPGQLIFEHRMQNARNQLFADCYSLQEIARMSGYSDVFAFSKAFRKYFGMAPSYYRKKLSAKHST